MQGGAQAAGGGGARAAAADPTLSCWYHKHRGLGCVALVEALEAVGVLP